MQENIVRDDDLANGGAPGPNNGGMTQMSARPVQAVAPPEHRSQAGDAARGEEAGDDEPEPSAKPKTASPKADKATDKSAARNPTTGPKVTARDARVNTGATRFRSAGCPRRWRRAGGVKLDFGDFCCPEYLATMTDRIRSQLEPESGGGGAGDREVHDQAGRHARRMSKWKSGTNNHLLDTEARRAILYTKQLPPLPGAVHRTVADRPSHFRLRALMKPIRLLTFALAGCATMALDGSDATPSRAAAAAATTAQRD